MKLILNNIGLIANTEINLNGITIIGGDNNTGKSTIGKALFAVLDGLNGLERHVKIDFYEKIKYTLMKGLPVQSLKFSGYDRIEDFVQYIINNSDYLLNNINLLHKQLTEFYSVISSSPKKTIENLGKNAKDEITNILQVPKADLYKASFTRSMSEEFFHQVGNIYSSSESAIAFEDDNFNFKIHIMDNSVTNIFPDDNIEYKGNVVYMDDPLVLDRLPYNGRIPRPDSYNHQAKLISNLVKSKHDVNLVDDVVINDKLATINSMLSRVCNGAIVKDNYLNCSYRKGEDGKKLFWGNVSSGLKTFIILKTLLLNGSLSAGDTIILDEPEVHLHPKWQLLFAEIIVLLQKQLNMRILLNTHSPYFLRAIQVYAGKHEIADRCTYYLSELEDGHAVIRDTTSNIETIYAKLAEPFQQLEDARWQDD